MACKRCGVTRAKARGIYRFCMVIGGRHAFDEPKAEIAIVFDGPPAHESGRFVEVEDASGKSIKLGRWEKSADGYWRLWITA